MGQYYLPINLDKKQYVCADEYKSGLKLMEHSYIGNRFVTVIENLLRPGGAWYKNHIVWAGDDADFELWRDDQTMNLFEFYGGIDENKIQPKCNPCPEKYRYLTNHDKREFIDLTKVLPIRKEWVQNKILRFHPLPLLTCEGNGDGCGDFDSYDNRMGTWARDMLSLECIKPKGFNEKDGTFVED